MYTKYRRQDTKVIIEKEKRGKQQLKENSRMKKMKIESEKKIGNIGRAGL